MYSIKLTSKPKQSLYTLLSQLQKQISKSRFTCQLSINSAIKRSRLSSSSFYYGSIQVSVVRLKEAKQYCGNHSGTCLLTFETPKKKYKYLEGADWVEFNDMINDFLDKKKLSAIVESSEVRVRLNDMRRTYYSGDHRGVWHKFGDIEDYSCAFKQSVESDFEEGTPGIYKKEYSVVG